MKNGAVRRPRSKRTNVQRVGFTGEVKDHQHFILETPTREKQTVFLDPLLPLCLLTGHTLFFLSLCTQLYKSFSLVDMVILANQV